MPELVERQHLDFAFRGQELPTHFFGTAPHGLSAYAREAHVGIKVHEPDERAVIGVTCLSISPATGSILSESTLSSEVPGPPASLVLDVVTEEDCELIADFWIPFHPPWFSNRVTCKN